MGNTLTLQLYYVQIGATDLTSLPDNLRAWIEFFRVKTRPELELLVEQHRELEKAAYKLNFVSLDPDSREAYEIRLKAKLDFDSAIDEASRTGRAEGKAEGRAEGKLEATRSILIRQGAKKFESPLPDWALNKINSAELQTLENWLNDISDAESIDDWLRTHH